jgi:hypothetical protein
MALMAAGDRAVVFTVLEEFGSQLAHAVRRAARHLHVELTAQDVRDLTIDAGFVLLDVAGGWDAQGGALPWVWAERRIAALVSAHIGQHADAIDEQALAEMPAPPAEASVDVDDIEMLEQLARLSPTCGLFVDALARVATARNRAVVLAVKVQNAMGDPSPAVTVGRQYGLNPDAVRQIVHRTRVALCRLVHSDDEFEPLRSMGWLA